MLKELSFHNKNLPPLTESIVTIQLDNENKIDTISSIGGSIRFSNIPHNALGKKVHITINSHVELFMPLEKQRIFYIVKSTIPLKNDTLWMPCNIGSVPTLIIK